MVQLVSRRDSIEISAKRFGCTGVINDQGFLIGIVTEGDLRRHMSPDLLSQKAGEIMTLKPITILPDILMAEALALLNHNWKKQSITTLFVTESPTYPAKPCGIIHIHDFLRMGIM